MEINAIRKAGFQEAVEISNWKYLVPYDVYSHNGGKKMVHELMDSEYYVVLCNSGGIIGFYCFQEPARVPCRASRQYYVDESHIDVGLGLRPDLCGAGHGYLFLNAALDFAKGKYRQSGFRLTVISLNLRAITVYARSGFVEIGKFSLAKDGFSLPFSIMQKDW